VVDIISNNILPIIDEIATSGGDDFSDLDNIEYLF
jgi:hypothetical protein